MYLDYFGLKEAPFSIAPDPRYLYMSERHREALAHLLYGVSGQGGFIVLTGEVGTGKTTICRCFLNQIPKNTDVAFVINPKLSARELMATICDELSITYPESASIKVLNDLINKYLLDAHAAGRHTVLIIDEAQNLRIDVLEQLRLLTNLETSEKKLLQIILLGQPELRDLLAKNELRQLAQRVTARYHLHELNQVEVGAYVNCRLAVAGRRGRLFEQRAIRKLYKLSKGVPRLINLISDRALLGAYAAQADIVDEANIVSAYEEISGSHEGVDWRALLSKFDLNKALSLAVVIMASGWFYSAFLNDSKSVDAVQIVNSESAKIENLETVDSGAGSSVLASKVATVETVDQNHNLGNRDSAGLTNSAVSAEAKLAENKEATAPIIDDLDSLRSHSDDKFYAFRSVFSRWGIEYNSTPFMLACDYAEMYGLRCLHKTGNWRSILRLDRPAVLTLINSRGEHIYLGLLALEGQEALVTHHSKKYWVSLDEIDRYWLGEYSLLWKLPPYKSNFVLPGQQDEEAWLKKHLGRYLKTSTRSKNVEDLVRNFQREVGLVPDGIAGSMTLIHINSRLHLDVPRLLGGL